MDFMQLGTVLAIVVICYLIGTATKLIPNIKNEFIPVICGVSGGILGVVGMVKENYMKNNELFRFDIFK